MAAPAYPGGLGIPRSAGNDHVPAICFALPREALQLWISGLPEPGRSGWTLETIETGGDWRSTYGGLHDGPRSERKRAGVSSSGLHVFLGGGCGRILAPMIGGKPRKSVPFYFAETGRLLQLSSRFHLFLSELQ